MTKRAVILAATILFILHAFSADSFAFWWLFKKKKEQLPAASPASYAIGSVEYRHDYGDAVRVAGSHDEFVICGMCPKPSVLERELKPVPIALKLTAPAAPVAVPPVQRVLSQPIEHSPASVSTTETLKTEEGGSEGSPASVEQVLYDPKADKHMVCREMSVYFELGSSRVRDEDRSKIEDFTKSPTGEAGVLVKGYTCDIGGKKFNDRLAIDRARAVADILEKSGVTPVMVSGEGKCCYVSEDKALNRRVEIRCSAIK